MEVEVMKMNRVWEMPNGKTFKIEAIRKLIINNLPGVGVVLDPFANEHSIKSIMDNHNYICNDLDKEYECDYNLEAQEFLKVFDDNSVDLILYDPPYSPRQVSELYKKLNKTVTMQDTNSAYWSKFKNEIAKKIKIGGKVISFGWNSNGIGKKHGFEIEEILLVCHGGGHYDTICTVEIKKKHQMSLEL
jgi:hypothetical protein